MEEIDIVKENHSAETLQINENMRSYLYSTVKWAKFIAIMGIIMGAFIFVISFFMPYLMATKAANAVSMVDVSGNLITTMYIIIAIIIILPNIYLLHFSNKMKNGILYFNYIDFEEGFRQLKKYFTFNGIVILVLMGMYALMAVTFLLGLAAGNAIK